MKTSWSIGLLTLILFLLTTESAFAQRNQWKAGIEKMGETEYRIDLKALDDLVDSDEAFTASVQSPEANGEEQGFSISIRSRQTIYRYLGLGPRDIISTINDEGTDTPASPLLFADKIRAGKAFSIQIIRRNKPITLEYTFGEVTPLASRDKMLNPDAVRGPTPSPKPVWNQWIYPLGAGKFRVARLSTTDGTPRPTEVDGMREARFMHYYPDENSMGWRIAGVRPHSIYKAMGLKNGDIIIGINGIQFSRDKHTRFKHLAFLANPLIDEDYTLEIVRRKQEISLHYDFE